MVKLHFIVFNSWGPFFCYFRCRDATENNNESFLPCAFGVVRVKLKLFWKNNSLLAQVRLTVLLQVMEHIA